MPNTKSCAVTGSPLDHLALGRSLNTQVSGSVCFQLSATPGTVLPVESVAVRPSNRSRARLLAPTDSAMAGSRDSGSEPLLRTSVWVGWSWTPGGITAAKPGRAMARNNARPESREGREGVMDSRPFCNAPADYRGSRVVSISMYFQNSCALG